MCVCMHVQGREREREGTKEGEEEGRDGVLWPKIEFGGKEKSSFYSKAVPQRYYLYTKC